MNRQVTYPKALRRIIRMGGGGPGLLGRHLLITHPIGSHFSLSVIETSRVVHLTDVVRVSGWIGPKVAAVPESQAFLRGAGARSCQATTLIPFDTNVIKVRIR